MNKKWLAAPALFTGALVLPAWAGSSVGLVTAPMVHDGDVLMFGAGPHENRPACVGIPQGGATWAVSLRTEKGKAMMSLLLTAHAQKKRVHVQGFVQPHCNDWGDRETPLYAVIID